MVSLSFSFAQDSELVELSNHESWGFSMWGCSGRISAIGRSLPAKDWQAGASGGHATRRIFANQELTAWRRSSFEQIVDKINHISTIDDLITIDIASL